MRYLVLSLLLLVPSSSWAQGVAHDGADKTGWHRLVGILSYLEADYPAAVGSQSASELEEQRAFIAEAIRTTERLGDTAAPFVTRLRGIQQRVDRAEDPQGVSQDCRTLANDVVRAAGLARSPSHRPDLKRAAELYQQTCATCHGADGSARTPAAEGLNPRPANFLDPARMETLTPYGAFNSITFGIPNTGMAGFPTLTDADRWALAFFVFTLRQPACVGETPKVSLEHLATSTDTALAAQHGAAALPCLRRQIPEVDEEKYLLHARAGIEEAMKLGGGGNWDAARGAIVDAYLRGFEPIEPRLRGRNPELLEQVEAAFGAMRLAAEHQSPDLQSDGRALVSLIDRTRGAQSGAQDAVTVFWLTLLILLREGFEALLVIVALLAVLKKMGRQDQARLVHAGWVLALAAGAVLFFFARELLDGARRELVEGVVALIAVGMLLYAALWLNQRANVRKMMGELRSKVSSALDRKSRAGLFGIAFAAMFRETFETALFLQGLSVDSSVGVLWGAIGGIGLLLALVLMIKRLGYFLPMKTLFNASTVLLLVTAVILLGKGIHALQEVGTLPLKPIPFVAIDFLGVYPDALSLVPQLLLALLPFGWSWWNRRRELRGIDSDDATGDAKA